MKVVVTGATGFVGSAIARRLALEGWEVVAAVREAPRAPLPHGRYVTGLDISRADGWKAALAGAEAVVHAAAHVHQFDANHPAQAAEYERINYQATIALAERALACGVQRFLFLSSIKVNGDHTEPGRPFRADDPPNPVDAYGASKLAAERKLLELHQDCGLECVIIRPPLVYGPGVKANFQTLMKMVSNGIPLPLGGVTARRSLVAVDNLVDLIATCLSRTEAMGRVLLVSDDHDLSVAEMLGLIGEALGKPARLIFVPPAVLEWSARLVGKEQLAKRLLWPLQVDSIETQRILGWHPPVSVHNAFRATADAFLQAGRR